MNEIIFIFFLFTGIVFWLAVILIILKIWMEK